MSTTAYRSNLSSKSFNRQHARTSPSSSTTTVDGILPPMNDPPIRYSSHVQQTRDPDTSIPESRLTNTNIPRKASSSTQASFSLPSSLPRSSIESSSNETANSKLSKQPYTFSNPPRELQRQSVQNVKHLRHIRSRQRVSSAPDENSFQVSPRSLLNQQKPSSANESVTPRSHNDHHMPSSTSHSSKRDEQQKHSLNALIKEQERSKVPRAVQKRRIILLFRRLPNSPSPLVSPRKPEHVSSPMHAEMPSIDIHQTQHRTERRPNDEAHHPEHPASTNNRFLFVDAFSSS